MDCDEPLVTILVYLCNPINHSFRRYILCRESLKSKCPVLARIESLLDSFPRKHLRSVADNNRSQNHSILPARSQTSRRTYPPALDKKTVWHDKYYTIASLDRDWYTSHLTPPYSCRSPIAPAEDTPPTPVDRSDLSYNKPHTALHTSK